MFTIKYTPSTSHWIVPPIIIGILIILAVIMLIQRVVDTNKRKVPFFDYKNYHFFEKNWDKIKLFGALALFIIYIFSMEQIGFLAASIICIFLFNILFAGTELLKEVPIAIKDKTFSKNEGFKSVLNSLIISVIFSGGIWFLFGQVFQITLP